MYAMWNNQNKTNQYILLEGVLELPYTETNILKSRNFLHFTRECKNFSSHKPFATV